jgi:hypothetical protein
VVVGVKTTADRFYYLVAGLLKNGIMPTPKLLRDCRGLSGKPILNGAESKIRIMLLEEAGYVKINGRWR